MGKWDVSEWVPSEEELRAELCNAREIDWPAEASKEANRRQQWMITAPDEYGEYMQRLLKDGRNFPEIPLRYMDAPAEWTEKSLEAILNQILSSPEEYQGYITGMVNRYLTACFKRLGGKWPSDIWDGSGNPYFTRICYDFCCPEWVGDDDLLRKIIVLQKLQTMISDRVRQDEPVNQTAEPAAGDGAAEQDERTLTADARCKGFIRKVHESAPKDDLRFYGPMKAGAPTVFAKANGNSQRAYIKRLHDQFNKENPAAHVAHSVFESAFKSYKSNLKKNNR